MLLVDKPAGPTSHDVVAAVRRSFQTRRVGHVGTLDPFATGLLILLVGRATRLAQYLVGFPKQYSGVIRLGLRTTTDDGTGELEGPPGDWNAVTDEDLRRATAAMVGRISQRPPRFSAKSVDGKRAYKRARRGEDFELESRDVDIHGFDVIGRQGADVQFTASVASGVYVRSLARDLGDSLGCGAHLLTLRRLSIGPFRLDESVTLDEVSRRTAPLRPPSDAVAHLTHREIGESERVSLRQGRAIPAESLQSGTVALLAGTDLVAVAESDGTLVRPSVVLEDP